MAIRLYDYFRSSAAYRVRIALNLKAVDYERVPVDLREGEQRAGDFRARNPQGLVPMLEIDGVALIQSLAIIEYLEDRFPEPPLLPAGPVARARVRAMAQLVACDIHPINNLRVLQYLKHELKQDQDAIDAWIRHWIAEGFAALETMARGLKTAFLSGDEPGLADLCLVPQMYNARRFETPLTAFPALLAVDARAASHPAFAAAHPEYRD